MFIGNKNILANIYRMQAYDSIMSGYFCIGFVNFMLKGFTTLFSLNNFKYNDKLILNYFFRLKVI